MSAAKGRTANIFSLAKGTVLAQVVFVLATPLLTRLYSAEQLGAFGLFSAIVVIMSKMVGFRYELAVPLPTQNRVAINLVILTSILAVLTLLVAYAGYQLAAQQFDLPTESHALHEYVWVIALGIAAFVIHESLVFWSIRQKQFDVIANARVINAASLAVLQLSGFLIGPTLKLLIVAYPMALLVSIIYQLYRLDWRMLILHQKRWRLLRVLMVRYKNFPIYTTLASSLSELSQALPLFVLGYFFGNQQVGYFFLARRIGLMPVSLVGRAIAQVNHADMLEHHRSGELGEIMLKQIHILQWISVVPAFLVGWFAPGLCEILFGEGWRTAGVFMQLLIPYVVLRFVFSPLNSVSYVAEWQKIEFRFEIMSSATSTAFLVWYAMNGDAVDAVGAYFLALAVAHFAYRIFLMSRLGIGALKLYLPAVYQLPLLAALAYLLI